jgi:methanogenic corrinoid protein MtbC1
MQQGLQWIGAARRPELTGVGGGVDDRRQEPRKAARAKGRGLSFHDPKGGGMAGYAQRVVVETDWGEDAGADASAGVRSAQAAPQARADAELTRLVRTIEAEIIPRLMLAHRAPRDAVSLANAVDCLPPCSDDVAEFARLVLSEEVPTLVARAHALRNQGLPLDAIYLHVLAPAARHLGDLWLADVADFTEVTVGLCRLQQLLRELGAEFTSEDAQLLSGHRALVVPVPGEQHAFGAQMVAQFFRRAGWEVHSEAAAENAQVIRLARREAFDVVGFSISRESAVPALATLIGAVRRASRNRRVCILVGGTLLLSHPELVPAVGADATAKDGPQAVEQAETLLGLVAKRR